MTLTADMDNDPTTSPTTIIITGISAYSPLSTHVVQHFLARLSDSQPRLSIALLGPSQTYLDQTASRLQSMYPNTSLSLFPIEIDLTSAQSMGIVSHTIRSKLGAWDIFIHNAPAHLPLPGSSGTRLAKIRGSDEDDWWNVFEINVHALHAISRHFFSKMRSGARFVSILPGSTTVAADLRALVTDDRMSAWSASSAAAERVVQYLNVENDSVSCSSVHVDQIQEQGEKEWDMNAGDIVALANVRDGGSVVIEGLGL